MTALWHPAGGYKLRRDAGPFAVVIEPAAVGWRGSIYLEGNAQHASTIPLGFYPSRGTAQDEAPKDAAKVLREALAALGDAS